MPLERFGAAHASAPADSVRLARTQTPVDYKGTTRRAVSRSHRLSKLLGTIRRSQGVNHGAQLVTEKHAVVR